MGNLFKQNKSTIAYEKNSITFIYPYLQAMPKKILLPVYYQVANKGEFSSHTGKNSTRGSPEFLCP